MQSLDIISVNFWNILISLCNLLIIFLLVKKFLFKPVEKMLNKRQSTIDKQYADADNAKISAEQDKKAWDEKMLSAEDAANDILRTATENAERQSKRIISDAKTEADGIIIRAENQAKLEKEKAKDEIKAEIADVSTLISEKILEREINEDDHKALIDSFISEIGEE